MTIDDNKLLSRKELDVAALHPGEGVPNRGSLQEEIAKLYQTDKKNVVVVNIKNRYGTHRSAFKARIYSSFDEMVKIEKENVVRKFTGKELKKVKRSVRKSERKKRYKMFGTIKRNKNKAERERRRNK